MKNESTIIGRLIECADSLEEDNGSDLTAVKLMRRVASNIKNNKLKHKEAINSLRSEADVLQIELGSNLVAVKLMNKVADILEKEIL